MKFFKLSVMTLMLSALLLGTQSCKSTKVIETAQLSGQWTLKSLNGVEATTLFKGTVPTAEFDLSAKRIFGSGGCNRYTGGFNLDKGVFSAPNLASTMMMCVEENQENQFLQTLGKESKLSIEKDELILSQNGKPAIVFVKIKPVSESDLVGEWKLQTISFEPANVLFGDNVPTIHFKDGRVGGNAGCNRYNSTYTLIGYTVNVGPMVTTRMACPHLEGEGKFTQLLEGTNGVAVEGNTLTFTKNGSPILVFTK